jgi:NitT/TauT family transport system ATP-binding protein
MSVLVIDALHKTYGTGPGTVTALEEISITTRPGEVLCIVGPSGCGKTTLLRCAAGLLPPTSGSASLDGRVITAPPRSMALVFQDYSRSLLPWATVHTNVVLPLMSRRIARAVRDDLATEALRSVGLDGEGSRHPWELSAGMQQRVAIARALAYQPRILLLDEPFASVDAQTRADLQDLLLEVWRHARLTMLFVTHDIDEAAYMADRIVVLTASPARVKETVDVDLGRPRDQIETRALPEFIKLRSRIFASVKAEAARQSTVGIRSSEPLEDAGSGNPEEYDNQS